MKGMTHIASLPTSSEIRSVDRELLTALRKQGAMSTSQMTEFLGVTATAVRQRVERLLGADQIAREKVASGRGRPSYRYRLTSFGRQTAGANPALLADAMWTEIISIEDTEFRDSLVAAIGFRLGRDYAKQVDASSGQQDSNRQDIACDQSDDSNDNARFTERMNQLAAILSAQAIDSSVQQGEGQLPILGFHSCPYPSLTDDSKNRSMCRLEERMLSVALGQEMHLSSCQLDGDACCHFSPIVKPTSPANV